jgi:hypothetical protein
MTAGYGMKQLRLLLAASRAGSCSKTLLEYCLLSEVWHSTVCYLRWRGSVIQITRTGTDAVELPRLLFRLVPSMPRTEETEFGLWATPRATEHGQKNSQDNHSALSHQVKLWPTPDACATERYNTSASLNATPRPTLAKAAKLWPTPRANDPEKRGDFNANDPRNGLPGAVKLWPTPTVQDASNNGCPSQMERHTLPLNAAVAPLPTPSAACGTGGQTTRGGKRKGEPLLAGIAGGSLNPDWVETHLMGYPLGWTDLPDGQPKIPKSRASKRASVTASKD